MQMTSTLSKLMRLLDQGEISETTYSFAAERLLGGESIDLSMLPRIVPPEAPTGVYIKPSDEPTEGTGVWSKPEIDDENTGVFRRGGVRPGRVRRPPRTVPGHPKAAHDDALAMRRFGALRTRRAASVSSEFGATRGATEHGAPAARFAPPIIELPSTDSDIVELSGMYMLEDSDAFESWAFEKTTQIDLETLKAKRAARASFANPVALPDESDSVVLAHNDRYGAQGVNYDEEIFAVDELTGAYQLPSDEEEVFAQSANYTSDMYGAADDGPASTSVLHDLVRGQLASTSTLPLSGIASPGATRVPPPPPVRPANEIARSDEHPLFRATLGGAAALPPIKRSSMRPVTRSRDHVRPSASSPGVRKTGPVFEMRDLLPEDKLQSGHGAPLTTVKTRRAARTDSPRVVTADAINRAQPAPRQHLAASGGGSAFEQGSQISDRDKLLLAVVLVLVVVLVTLLVVYAMMIS